MNSKILTLLTIVTLITLTSVSTAYANTVHDEVQRYGYPLGWGSDQIQHDHPHDRTIWLEQESDTYSGISSAEYEEMQQIIVSNPTAEGIYNVQTFQEDFIVLYRVRQADLVCPDNPIRLNSISLYHNNPHGYHDGEYMIWFEQEIHTGYAKYAKNEIAFTMFNMTTDGTTFESHGFIHAEYIQCDNIDNVFPIVVTGNCDGTDFLLRGHFNATKDNFDALCIMR